MATISVIIPYLDEYDYLREAVASVLRQSLPPAEIILVCNRPGGEDKAFAFPNTAIPVRTLHAKDLGSAQARNAGLAAASGEWVQFLDVDDLLLPDKLARQLAVAGEGDVIVAPHVYRKTSGEEIPSAWAPADAWAGLLNSALGSTSAWLFRRDAVTAVGGWDPEVRSHQEYELLFRLLSAGKVLVPVGQPDTMVRQRKKGSITSNTSEERALAGIRLREKMRTMLQARGDLTPLREEAFRQYVFRQLRGLYRVDPAGALAAYELYFGDQAFRPRRPVSAWYRILFARLGFAGTEKWLSRYRHIRDRYLAFLPVND